MSANDELRSAILKRHLMALRAGSGLAQGSAGALARDTLSKLLELIAERLPNVPRKGHEASAETSGRLGALLAKIDEMLGSGYGERLDADLDALVDLASKESAFAIQAMRAAVPIDWEFEEPSRGYLRSLSASRPFQGRHLAEWYQGLEIATQGKIRGEIRDGLAQGESVDDIVRRIKGTRENGYKDGILDLARRQLEGVVRTAANHVSNHARNATYQANDDIVKGVLYVATLDGRTTLTCATLDGQVFPLDSGPRPPQHFGCRSTTVPILKSWKELGIDLKEAPDGTRASMDGQVPENLSFDEWFDAQGEEFQLEYLGPTRYEAWRESGSLQELVSASHKPIPVSAL